MFFQEHRFELVGDINLDYTFYFMISTMIGSFLCVILGNRKSILSYCENYHDRSYVMPYAGVLSPIVFAQFERAIVKSKIDFAKQEKIDMYETVQILQADENKVS